MTSYDGIVRVEHDGTIATITFTRPERANAMDRPFFPALSAALDDVRDARSARVVVLRGEGRHFCAGGDLDHPLFDHPDARERERQIVEAYDVTNRLLDLPLPVVAVVQGRCAGAGDGNGARRPTSAWRRGRRRSASTSSASGSRRTWACAGCWLRRSAPDGRSTWH